MEQSTFTITFEEEKYSHGWVIIESRPSWQGESFRLNRQSAGDSFFETSAQAAIALGEYLTVVAEESAANGEW